MLPPWGPAPGRRAGYAKREPLGGPRSARSRRRSRPPALSATGPCNQSRCRGLEETMSEALRQQRLLDRAGFGARPGDRERLRRQGAEAWVAAEVAPAADPALERRLAAFPSLGLRPGDALEGMDLPERRRGRGGEISEDAKREIRRRTREITRDSSSTPTPSCAQRSWKQAKSTRPLLPRTPGGHRRHHQARRGTRGDRVPGPTTRRTALHPTLILLWTAEDKRILTSRPPRKPAPRRRSPLTNTSERTEVRKPTNRAHEGPTSAQSARAHNSSARSARGPTNERTNRAHEVREAPPTSARRARVHTAESAVDSSASDRRPTKAYSRTPRRPGGEAGEDAVLSAVWWRPSGIEPALPGLKGLCPDR